MAGVNYTTQADFSSYSAATNIDLLTRPGDVLLKNTSVSLNATYDSRVLGGPGAANWRSITWRGSLVVANISDDFNGSSLAPKWTWFNPPASYAVGSPRPGYLTFRTLHNTNFNNAAHSGHFLYQNLTGDFDVALHLQVTFTNTTSQKAGLLVMVDASNWYSLYRRPTIAGPIVRAVTTVAGSTVIVGSATATPDYLRIRRLGNVLQTFYGDDGQNWTPFLDVGPGSLPPYLWVGVMGSDFSSITTLTVDVDYVHFTFPPSSVEVGTRVGNSTNPGDASWGPWSPPYASPTGSPVGGAGRYLQYRLRLITSSPYVRPYISDVGLLWDAYAASGTVTTQAVHPGGATFWNLLSITADAGVGRVNASFSLDGTSWRAVGPGSLNLTIRDGMQLRLALTTPDTSRTPIVRELRMSLDPPPISGSPLPPLLWWLLLVPLILLPLLFFIRWRSGQTFRATDLFLIHSDGRLVLRVGGKDSPMTDEAAVSGMFTLMAKFVQDSFKGARGAPGELRSLQVDDREVAIAKGEYLFLALLGEGAVSPALEGKLVGFFRALEDRHRQALRAWDGLGDHLGPAEQELRTFLESRPRRRLAGSHGE